MKSLLSQSPNSSGRKHHTRGWIEDGWTDSACGSTWEKTDQQDRTKSDLRVRQYFLLVFRRHLNGDREPAL